MKNFVKENWYKLMVGSSMMMASFGFMIYAVSPAYSSSKKTEIPDIPVGTNAVNIGDYSFFVDGGYVYKWHRAQNDAGTLWKGDAVEPYALTPTPIWVKSKLP